MDFKCYKKLLSFLKKNCPVAYPVSVRRVKLKDADGDCILHERKFYIRINKDISEASAIDTLVHEWAHALAWNHLYDSLEVKEFDKKIHNATWGVAYSEVYQAYENCYLPPDRELDRPCKSKYK